MIDKIEVLIKHLKAELAVLEANIATAMHLVKAKTEQQETAVKADAAEVKQAATEAPAKPAA